jgi:hypothetical protein
MNLSSTVGKSLIITKPFVVLSSLVRSVVGESGSYSNDLVYNFAAKTSIYTLREMKTILSQSYGGLSLSTIAETGD